MPRIDQILYDIKDSKLSPEDLIEISHLVDKALKQIRSENLKSQNVAVNSVDELVCPKHYGSKFIVESTIPGSDFYISNKSKPKSLNVYVCSDCASDNTTNEKTVAYECRNCGIVKFSLVITEYRRRIGTKVEEGVEYSCGFCNKVLGLEKK